MKHQISDSVFNKTKVIMKPGAAYADNVRMFQGIPGIERAPNGRLWATWYGGGINEDRYNYIMLNTSADNGETWSNLKLVVDPDGPGPMRAFDPCLWHDPAGRMWLFWNQALSNRENEYGDEEVRNWFLWGMHTGDSGRENPKWSKPERLCEAIMLNKPTVLSTGEWLLCSSDWAWDCSARVFKSTDKGKTWNHLGRANVADKSERSFDEHMVVERKDGSLWMLVRTRYGLGESFSHDRGRFWSYVKPTGIGQACSRFFIRRLKSGNLILVKHGRLIEQCPISRCMLTAFVSADDGRTWKGGLMLDERVGVSYPDGVQAQDGTIYVIYDYNRGTDKEILMARFTEKDILAKKLCSPASKLRLLVNKATGKNPSL